MKYLDRVRVISDDYEDCGIKRGDEGHILAAAIRGGTFLFYREDPLTGEDNADASVRIKDPEPVTDYHASDETLLEDLPGHDPAWPCKVENGYIVDLLGNRFNKIPYDYDS